MRLYCAQIAQVWKNSTYTEFALAHDAVFCAVENYVDLVMFSEHYATGWRPAGSGSDDVLSVLR